jgi:glycosyltransferase involved in cell wall biosynthesis
MKSEVLPLVSVVIPLYNHAQFVGKCLESVAEETYPNLEVLVIDDGSKDDSYGRVREWYSRRERIFQNFEVLRQENQGIARTLNKLVRMAKGEFITVLASDDYLLRGGIDARVKHLTKNPHLLGVFGDCLVVDESDKVISESGVSEFFEKGARKKALKNQKLLPLELILRWSIPGPVFTMRKDACNIVGYYDETLAVEDRDFYLRLLIRGALGFVDYKVACYRWHAGNIGKDVIGWDLRKEALKIASLKASSMAKGILKIALILDYEMKLDYQIKNDGNYRKKIGESSVKGTIKSILIRAAWKILSRYHNFRLSFMGG